MSQSAKKDKVNTSKPAVSEKSKTVGSNNNMSNSQSKLNKDVLFMMSKKIAQLTKVIYYLNTKNEDHGLETQYLSDQYEEEIKQILDDAANAIKEQDTKLKEATSKLSIKDQIILAYSETIKKKDDEIKQHQEKYDALVKELHEKDKVLRPKSTDVDSKLIEQLRAEVESLKDKNQRMIFELNADCQQKLDEQTRTFEKELEHLKKQHIAIMKTHRDEELHREKEIVGNNRKHEEELSNLRDSHAFEIRELNTRLKESEDKNEKIAEITRKSMMAELEKQKELVKEKIQEISRMKGDYDSMSAKYGSLDSERSRYKSLMEDFERQLEAKTIECNDFEHNYKLYFNESKKQVEEIEMLKTSLDTTNDKLNLVKRDLKFCQEEAQQHLDNLESAKAQLVDLKAQISILNTQLQDFKKLEASLKDELQLRDDMIEDLRQTMQAQVIKHKQTLTSALEKLKNAMQQEAEENLSKLRAEITSDFESKINFKDAEIKRLEGNLVSMKAEHEQKVKSMEERYLAEKTNLADKIKALEIERDALMAEISEHKKTINAKSEEIKAHLATIQQLNNQVRMLETDKADLFQKMMTIERSVRTEVTDKLNRETAELVKNINQENAQKMANFEMVLKQEKEEALELQKKELHFIKQQEIKQLIEEHDKKVEGFYTEMKEKDAHLAAVNLQNAKLETRVDELIEENRVAMEEAERNLIATLSARETELETAAATREKQIRFSFNLQISGLEKDHERKLQNLIDSHKQQLDQLEKEHRSNIIATQKEYEMIKSFEIERLNRERDELIASIKREKEEALKKTREMYDLEKTIALEKLAMACEEELNEEKDKLAKLVTELDEKIISERQLMEKITHLEVEINDGKLAQKALEQKIEMQRFESIDIRNTFEMLMLQQKEAAEQTLADELRNAQEVHLNEIQDMLSEFNGAKAFLKKEIERHLEEIKQHEIKYINREARDIDIATIKQLECEIERQKGIAKHLEDQLAFYKLDLKNKDMAFNKIFNNPPFVGLMNSQIQKAFKSHFRIKPKRLIILIQNCHH